MIIEQSVPYWLQFWGSWASIVGILFEIVFSILGILASFLITWYFLSAAKKKKFIEDLQSLSLWMARIKGEEMPSSPEEIFK